MIYAESSAVLAWLLGNEAGDAVKSVLDGAEAVVVSELTLIECERVLLRAVMADGISEAEMGDRRATLNRAATHWTRLGLGQDVMDRVKRAFPAEPVRTLDALHLASALLARSAAPGVRLLSLDERVRQNGEALGFDVLP